MNDRESTSFPSSPCVNICTLDDANVCAGCYRHLDEIVSWPRLTAVEQRAVIERAEGRRYARVAHDSNERG